MAAGMTVVAGEGVDVGELRVAVGVALATDGTRVAVDVGSIEVGVATWTDGEGWGSVGDAVGVAGSVGRGLN